MDFLCVCFFLVIFSFLSPIGSAAAIDWENGETTLKSCKSVRERPTSPTPTTSSPDDYFIWCPMGTLLMGGGIKCDNNYAIQKSVPVICVGDRCDDQYRFDSNGSLPGLFDYSMPNRPVNSGPGKVEGSAIKRYGLAGRCSISLASQSPDTYKRPLAMSVQCCPMGSGFPENDQCNFKYMWGRSITFDDDGIRCDSQQSGYTGFEFTQNFGYSRIYTEGSDAPDVALYKQNPIRAHTNTFQSDDVLMSLLSKQMICCDYRSSGVLFQGDIAHGGYPDIEWKKNSDWIGEQGGWISQSGSARCKSPSFPINLLVKCGTVQNTQTGLDLNSLFYDPSRSETSIVCNGQPPQNAYAECLTLKPPALCPATFTSLDSSNSDAYSFFTREANKNGKYYPGAIATEEVFQQCSDGPTFILRLTTSLNFGLTNKFEMEKINPSVSMKQRFSFINNAIRSLETNQCLQVNGAMNINGSPVGFSVCDSGKATQKWIRAGSRIQLSGTSRCLDVSAGNRAFDQDVMQIWTCDSSNTNQQFSLISSSTLVPNTLLNDIIIQWTIAPDHALNSNGQMSPLIISVPVNQRFSVTDSSRIYSSFGDQIRSIAVDKCLEIDGEMDALGGGLILANCDSKKVNQRWTIVNDATGVQIRVPGINSPKCVDLLLMTIWDCTSTDYQRFNIFWLPYNDGFGKTVTNYTCEYGGVNGNLLAPTLWKPRSSATKCYRRGDRDWNNQLMCGDAGIPRGKPILDPKRTIPYTCECDAGFYLSSDGSGCIPKCGDGVITGGEQCDGSSYCNVDCKISAQFGLAAPSWNRLKITNVDPPYDAASTSYTTPIDYNVKVMVFDDQNELIDLPTSLFAGVHDANKKMFYLSKLSNNTIILSEKRFAGRKFQVTLYPLFHSSLDGSSAASESLQIELPCSCDPINNPNGIPIIDSVDQGDFLAITDDANAWMSRFIVQIKPQSKCASKVLIRVNKPTNVNVFDDFLTITDVDFDRICSSDYVTKNLPTDRYTAQIYNQGFPNTTVFFSVQGIAGDAAGERDTAISKVYPFRTKFISRIRGMVKAKSSLTPVAGVSIFARPLDEYGVVIPSINRFTAQTRSDGSYDIVIVDDTRTFPRVVTFEISPSLTLNNFTHRFEGHTLCKNCRGTNSTPGCCPFTASAFSFRQYRDEATLNFFDASSFVVRGNILFSRDLFSNQLAAVDCASVGTTIRAIDQDGNYLLDPSTNQPREVIIQVPASRSSVGVYEFPFTVGTIAKLILFKHGVNLNHTYKFDDEHSNPMLPGNYVVNRKTQRQIFDPTENFFYIDKDYQQINFIDDTIATLTLQMPLGNCGGTLGATIPLKINEWCSANENEVVLYSSSAGSMNLPAMKYTTDIKNADQCIQNGCDDVLTAIRDAIEKNGARIDTTIDLSDVAKDTSHHVQLATYYSKPVLALKGGMEALHYYPRKKEIKDIYRPDFSKPSITFYAVDKNSEYSIMVSVIEYYPTGACANSSATVKVVDRASSDNNACFYGCPNSAGQGLIPSDQSVSPTLFRYNFTALTPRMNPDELFDRSQRVIAPPFSALIELFAMGSNHGFMKYDEWIDEGHIVLPVLTRGVAPIVEYTNGTGQLKPLNSYPLPSPSKPYAVIRKPPGDMSSATINTDREIQFDTRVQETNTRGRYLETAVQVGAELEGANCVGIGYELCIQFKASGYGGEHSVNDDQKGARKSKDVVRWSSRLGQSISTGDSSAVVGKAGDIYAMQSLVIQFMESFQISTHALIDETSGNAIADYFVPGISPAITWEAEEKPSTTFIARGDLDALIEECQEKLNAAVQDNRFTDAAAFEKLLDNYHSVINYVDEAEAKSIPYHEYLTRYMTSPRRNYITHLHSNEENVDKSDWESKSRFTFYGGGAKVKMAYSVTDSIVTSEELIDDTSKLLSGTFGLTASFGVFLQSDFEIGQQVKVSTSTVAESEDQSIFDVEYEFGDANVGDHFDVEVRIDPVFKTPVFKVISGKSSCPSVPGTMPRHIIAMKAVEKTLLDMPPDRPALFELQLTNNGELTSYYLSYALSNANKGMKIFTAGQPLGSRPLLDVPPHGRVTSVIVEIEKGALLSEYEVDVTVAPVCETEFISATEKLSVTFADKCVQAELVGDTIKGGEWSINQALLARQQQQTGISVPHIPLTIINPERKTRRWYLEKDQKRLIGLNAEYRLKGSFSWTPMDTCGKDSSGHDIAVKFDPFQLITNVSDRIKFNWCTPNFPGEYDIRVRTLCNPPSGLMDDEKLQYATTISPVYSGVIDVDSPKVFGIPQPADGKWRPGVPISIEFNENIECDAVRVVGFNDRRDVNVKMLGESIDNNFTYTVEDQREMINMNYLCKNNIIYFSFDSIFFSNLKDNIGTEVGLTVRNVRDLSGNTNEVASFVFLIDHFDYRSTPVILRNVRIIGTNYKDVIGTSRQEAVFNEIKEEIIALITPILQDDARRNGGSPVKLYASAITFTIAESSANDQPSDLALDVHFGSLSYHRDDTSVAPVDLSSALSLGLSSRVATKNPSKFRYLSMVNYHPQSMLVDFTAHRDRSESDESDQIHPQDGRFFTLSSIFPWLIVALVANIAIYFYWRSHAMEKTNQQILAFTEHYHRNGGVLDKHTNHIVVDV